MTYPIEAVVVVGAIKMLETSHIVFVDDLVEELIDIFDRERTDSRAIHWFDRIWFALCKHPVENIIIQVGTYLLSELGPRLTDIRSLENIKHFLPCGSIQKLLPSL